MQEGDDMGTPDQQGSDGKSDQQRFDEQVAEGTWSGLVILGGLGIFAALVISVIALANSRGAHTTTTVIAPATAGQTTTPKQAAPLTGDALGKQLFVSGDPSVGAVGCGSCHTMKAAGTSASIGPSLDKELTADPASATLESIVSPNKEIATGFKANVMPKTYGRLTKRQLDALANYVYHSTNLKAKRASTTTSTTP